MSLRRLPIGLSCAAILALARLSTGRADLMCSVAIVPYFRAEDMTYVLGTALDTSVTDHPDSLAVSLTRRVAVPIRVRRVVAGQLIRVQSVRGAGADSISKRLASGDSIAVLIRWGLAADCSPVSLDPTIPPGEFDHFIVALRPSVAWIAGHPTFEVGPSSEFGVYPGWLRRQRGVDAAMLSPMEFSSFLDALPTYVAWLSDCRAAVRRLEEWGRDHRTLSKKYPVPDALHQLGAICSKQNHH